MVSWIMVDPRGVNDALDNPNPQDPSLPDRYVEPHPAARHLFVDMVALDAQERLSIYRSLFFKTS